MVVRHDIKTCLKDEGVSVCRLKPRYLSLIQIELTKHVQVCGEKQIK